MKVKVCEEVKGYAKKNNMERPKNTRRCWALSYAPDGEGIGFHVDILPCLPDTDAGRRISRANFADRWYEDDHAKAEAFFRWVEWLRADMDSLLNSAQDVAAVEKTLDNSFGDDITTRALNRLGIKSGSIRSGMLLQATSTAVSRFNVPHREQPKWPARLTHGVTIEGRATRQGWRTLVSPDRFRRMAKHYSLRFEAETNVPWPHDVYWQVVNTGDEAEACNGLRGQIFSGLSVRKERTLYTGFHWIECFIVKDGVLVARSGEFVLEVQ